MKKNALILAAALGLVACGGNAPRKAVTADSPQTTAAAPDTPVAETQPTTAEVPDMHTAETSLDYLGTYEGTLPAADCPGIRTTLTLDPDGSYSLHMKYIDRDTELDEKGVFSVRENLLTLTQLDDGSEEYYKVEENRLRMLDDEKQPVTGALAENYVLHKTK